ncbi:MAG: DUF427 domain-containing protein [Pseudomonadota bacterium]
MADRITIRKAPGTWSVRAGGAVIAETQNAQELSETGYPARIYFPREDIAMAFLDRTDKTSTCPYKGDATYFSIVAKNRVIENAGWSYETPKQGVEAIAGHIAFMEGDYLQIEQV